MRQRDEKFASPPDARTARLHATVQAHQSFDQREADSQPSVGPLRLCFDLREHVEHARQHVRRKPDAIVAHVDHDGLRLDAVAERDVAAVVGVLGRIGQEIRHHLSDAHRV